MPPDAKAGLEQRLTLISLALEEALRNSRWSDSQSLLDQRAGVISELAQVGGPSAEVIDFLQKTDSRVMSFYEARKAEASAAQKRMRNCQKAIDAYHGKSNFSSLDKAG